MPTYQYRCTDCGHDLEAVQKFTDAALTECPNCGGSLRKVFNAVGVVFKGSGFYRTDSRKAPSEGSSGGSGTSAPAKEKAGSDAGSNGSGSKDSGSDSGSGSGSGSKEKSAPAPKSDGGSSSSSTGSKAASS